MTFLGVLDGIGEAVTSFSQAGSGFLSDRLHKRKALIWTGYVCASLSRIGYSFSASFYQLLPFRVVDRLGKIRAAPRDAMVADLSTKDGRGSAFGVLRALDNLGAVCGILVCIALVEYLGYRLLFVLAAVPSLVGAALIYVYVQENSPRTLSVPLSVKELPSPLVLFFGVSAVFALGSFSYSFLLLFARESQIATGFIPVLYLVFTAAASGASHPFGKLADKTSRTLVIVCGFVLFGAMCAGFICSPGTYGILSLFVVYGLHKGALEPVQRTLVSELAPASRKASILGVYSMVMGGSALFASVIAGVLWDTCGMTAPFWFSLTTSACSSVLMLVFAAYSGGS
jgi:MFS family permease